MKESNTIFDGTYFIYTCSYCGVKVEEPADPKKNPNPFSFISTCTSCGFPRDPDYSVIEAAHAAISSARK